MGRGAAVRGRSFARRRRLAFQGKTVAGDRQRWRRIEGCAEGSELEGGEPGAERAGLLRFRWKFRLCAGLLVTVDLDRAGLGLNQLLERLRNQMAWDQGGIEHDAAKCERSAEAAP